MSADPIIWVLGAVGTKADKHIEWSYSWPYFGDSDILIINLESLSEQLLELLEPEKVIKAEQIIFDRFTHGGIIIIITSPRFEKEVKHNLLTNYYLSPIDAETQTVEEGHEIQYDKEKHPFSDYLKHVKKFDFYLKDYNFEKLRSRTRIFFSGHNPIYLRDYQVTDKAGHDLGYGFGSTASSTGKVIFLPPTKYSTIDEINTIIDSLRKEPQEIGEWEPDWANKIKVTGMSDLEKEIEDLNKKKVSLEKEIIEVFNKKKRLRGHVRLLYSNSTPLERAVKNAFNVLGFDEIRQDREKDKEDWVIDIRSNDEIKLAVIEVEGSEKRTSIEKLDQCHRWVNDYYLKGKEVKGIFVSNQFRKIDYPSSKNQRINYEHNQEKYTNTRKLCIIPSCILFEAVNKALSGNLKPRADLEKLFIETSGILTEI